MSHNERWEKIEQIFNQAILLPVDERVSFIEQNCADADIREEVISLLNADAQSSEILNRSVFPIVARLFEDDHTRLLKKSKFASYQLEVLLGRGGMGTVFLAIDKRLERSVALKILSPTIAGSSELVQRFRQEAKAASAISHPNIAHIYEFDIYEGTYFLAMEYVAGKTLRDLIKEKQIDLLGVVDTAIQIAEALKAAHQQNIIHRDIKPENIMLTNDGLVKVLDFGLAKLEVENQEDESTSLETSPGTIIGTTAYMSPEQIRGNQIDTRTDLWSLGVVIYELVTGERPFTGESKSDVQAAILLKEPAPLPFFDELPELGSIVQKTLAKDVSLRYQSANEIIPDLRALKRQVYDYLQTGRPPTSPEYSVSPSFQANGDLGEKETSGSISNGFRNYKLSLALSLSIILLFLTGLGFWFFNSYATFDSEEINSVAVLPFVNSGNNSDAEFLSDGITESLINNLTQLPKVKVIARSSSFKYKGKEIDPQEVADSLGVEAIVMGKVAQNGDNLLINVELIKTSDKTQIWGEQYIRKVSDLLQVQSLISKEIAENLHVHLTGAQQQRITKRETMSTEAYELVLKSKVYNRKGGNENMKKSLDFLNQAIALDPNYALAYVGLSIAYRNLVDQSILTPQEGMPKAESAAYKALELDENLAEAHFALATIKRDAWQWEESERGFKRAIELNPNLSRAHGGYASYLNLMNRHDEAIAEINIARELDPLSPIVNANVSWALYLARRYDEAIEAIQKELELDNENPDAHYILGYIYMAKGMSAEAIAEFQETIRLGLDIPGPKIYQGVVYGRKGEITKAREILKQLQESKEYVSPAELAILYAALGEKEQAFESLEKAYSIHDIQLQTLAVDAAFDSLRSDQRFQDLLERIGLPTSNP